MDAVASSPLKARGAGRVSITATAEAGAFVVPSAALTRVAGESVVFVATDPTGTGAALVPVEVIGRSEGNLVVLGEALSADARVAARGVFYLKSLALLGE